MLNRTVCSEERLLAAQIADAALDGFDEEMSPVTVQRLRAKLIEELLWTAWGRERIGRVLGRKPG